MLRDKHCALSVYICHTNQHTEEPQVCFVIFLEPGSINVKPMADEAYHGVVRQDDQDEKGQCSYHYSSVRDKNNFEI